MHTKRISFCLSQVLGIALGLTASMASAADFTVSTTDDAVDTDPGDGSCLTAAGPCSLRAAIQESNALAGADTIQLPAGVYNLTLTGVGDQVAASGDLDINDTLTINGAGADRVFIDGMAADRVFYLHQGFNATISGVTIRNGLADGMSTTSNGGFGSFGGGDKQVDGTGGGIKSEGGLTLRDCNIDRNVGFNGAGGIKAFFWGYPNFGYLTVERCNITHNGSGGGAGGFGGNIYAENIQMTVRDSVISDSISTSTTGMITGGGIYYSNSNYPTPPLSKIINTTISGNSVMSQGGGVYIMMGPLNIENSTLSGNSALAKGGALYTEFGAEVTLTNTTLAYNNAPEGGGLFDTNTNPMVTLKDSIVAANTGGNCVPGTNGLATQGHNLDSDGSCGVDLANLNPLLEPLADNGGPGLTHALGAGSDALDAAGSCQATDQRSYTRPTGSCDLGAVEMGATPPANEIVTPVPNTTVSTVPNNNPPTAFNLPAAVTAGSVLYGVMNAFDPDGDALIYQFVTLPTQGNVGLPMPGSAYDFPGGYVYTPFADASGNDSFTFKACDSHGACSNEGTITISISSGTVSSEITVQLTTSSGNTNDLVILPESTLNAIAPDTDYSYPLGGYFFSVDNIPTDNNGTATEAVVTIQLPVTATIPADAEVRKLDKTGVWQTLSSQADATLSSAVIDTSNNTITLTLKDNDIFDLNPAVGVINDPVAIGVLKSAAAPTTEPVTTPVPEPVSTVTPEPTASPTDNSSSAPTQETTRTTQTGPAGGGGSLNLLLLILLAGGLYISPTKRRKY